MSVHVAEVSAADRAFLRAEMTRHWISAEIYSRRRRFQADELPGFIAWIGAKRAGQLTYTLLDDGEFEVVTLSAVFENAGVGTALLDAAITEARRLGARRIMLTTSNDNLAALGFYQRRGWRLAAIHRGVIDELRQSKPIPETGQAGIPLHDEVELEYPV